MSTFSQAKFQSNGLFISIAGTVFESKWRPQARGYEPLSHPTLELGMFDLKHGTKIAITADCELNKDVFDILASHDENLAKKLSLYCWDKYKIKNERSFSIGLICIDNSGDISVMSFTFNIYVC